MQNNICLSEEKKRRISSWPEDLRYEFEERAAIHEFDGGLTRNESEWLAYRSVARKVERNEEP